MTIKKVRANYHNGTEFETHHYETQVKQVKVLDANGVATHDLETELTNIKNSVTAVDQKAGTAQSEVDSLETKVGNTATLTTTNKTVVPAINELKSKADTNTSSINSLGGRVDALEIDMDNHNHDNLYLKLSGGDLTGTTAVANNVSFAGKTTGGTNVNIGKVDASNNVILGSINNNAVIHALNGSVSVNNGTNTYEVFHAGNMGAGSGLDADKLDGVEGSSYARKDAVNYFTQNQVLDDGSNLYFESANGSEQAGQMIWRNSAGVQKGKVLVGVSGDFSIFAGNINGHTFKSTGELFSTYSHVLDATSREVRVQFKGDSADAGMGLYMNNGSKQMGIFDWQSGEWIMTTDRTKAIAQFVNGLEIQGHRIFVQSGQPASPQVGDLWFDI